MKVREVSTTLTGALEGRFGHPERTTGLHASQIWGDLKQSINKRRGDTTEEELSEYGSLGFLWEKMIEKALGDLTVDSDTRYLRPGEQEYEGILWTPDYLDLDFMGDGGGEIGLEEWKVKWCNATKGDNLEKNFWEWLVQTKGYCKVMGLHKARIRALFIVGDWKRPCPRLREWELEFSDRELDENMSMLVGHARRKGWL